MPASSDALGPKEVEGYLNKLGIPPGSIGDPNRSTLARLQRAHVTTVPFETLSITGDPHGEREGEGIVLSIPHLYEKIVERGRGGYCFELNGLFYALLVALGYDADRIAARVTSDGALRMHVSLLGSSGNLFRRCCLLFPLMIR
jgi:N-hydroxyarylamine O-acetyltransferase